MNTKLGRKIVTIMNVKLNGTSLDGVLDFVAKKNKKFLIVTPNPEIVLKAQEDEKLLEILNSADLSLPDGIGLAMAKKFYELPSQNAFTLLVKGIYIGARSILDKKWLFKDFQVVRGREAFLKLVKFSRDNHWKIFLFGGREGVAQKAGEVLDKKFPGLKWKAETGPFLDEKARPVLERDSKLYIELIKKINEYQPDILFVGLGCPKQEKFVNDNLAKLKVGGAMVIGRTLDWVAGQYPPCPKWMAYLGLEWLWRFLTGSTNLKRIVNAAIVFPYKVFREKLKT